MIRSTPTARIRMTVNFDVATDANTDQILTQIAGTRQIRSCPPDVVNAGVTVQKSTTAPLILSR